MPLVRKHSSKASSRTRGSACHPLVMSRPANGRDTHTTGEVFLISRLTLLSLTPYRRATSFTCTPSAAPRSSPKPHPAQAINNSPGHC
jgi:hypothetical protein